MKALVLREYGKFSFEDVPDPQVEHENVLIKVKACSICGSDIHGIDGSTGRRIPPIIMGHEASGIIEEVGTNVKSFAKGERVTFDSTIYCGKCYFCKQGKVNLCDNRRVLGVSCSEYHQDGAFAEYIVVPQHILYHLPDNITFEQAAMVEPLSIALHAINRTPVSLNNTAVVVGTGMIGLLIIQLLRLAGCGKIIAIDIDRDRLDAANKLGAYKCIHASEDNIIDEINNLTNKRGADIAFEVVGITNTFKTAVNALRKGGFLTLVGNLSPIVEFPLQTAVTREITINGTCASSGEYDNCLEMISNGSVNVDILVSATVPLKEGSLWFERLYKKEHGLMKVILIP